MNHLDLKILSSMADGLTVREIASKLNLTYDTVEGHMIRLRSKFELRNSCHAVAWAFRNGYLK